jgi:UDP-N-acetylglucosamine transferase subunit ALG13
VDILVTVGMAPWPFDRLIDGITPLCSEHNVFAQIGTSRSRPPCRHARFVSYPWLQSAISRADVVVTHAGNTVRLVQRVGKVPIAVARRSAFGEMPNDHQVTYLTHEERVGRVVAIWDLQTLPSAVRTHDVREAQLLAERDLPPAEDAERIGDLLDALLECTRVRRSTPRSGSLLRSAIGEGMLASPGTHPIAIEPCRPRAAQREPEAIKPSAGRP